MTKTSTDYGVTFTTSDDTEHTETIRVADEVPRFQIHGLIWDVLSEKHDDDGIAIVRIQASGTEAW